MSFTQGDADDCDEQNLRHPYRVILWFLASIYCAYWAYDALSTGQASYTFRRHSNPYLLYGYGAIAHGLQLAFIASFLHFQCFWVLFPQLASLRVLAARTSIIGFIIATVPLLVFILRHPDRS